ncbi:putative permease of the drug/metabolite transporter (DMT) superfamily [Bradyrhizobium oligotrophicum S58]|uniref:Putative permease of the drug/metabolite transporter (DMT) superfamily n=1 Tax=Bradyrhizobium oligotrophicum S58 TaxID=1245469 RepID=M4Z3J5_9BRAD|nr:DMT family transporter [Bradyrhizobium oligotrophicum]BAM87933.1 putative permease of the drug/metabolite transporter (DMT) superfamily [Bradyrhizobium oligotrophicum S58]
MLSDLAALAAAFSIAVSNVIAPSAVRHLGPVRFNAVRLAAALLSMLAPVTLRGRWAAPSHHQLLLLAASSLLGVVVADSCFYAALARLGPRLTAVVYASWTAFAAVLGYLLLDETLSTIKIIGVGCILGGVCVAIIFRQPGAISDETHGSLRTGLLFGLAAALFAAAAVLVARPVMAAGLDPALATSIRAAIGLAGLLTLSVMPGGRSSLPVDRSVMIRSALSGVLGMGVGMTLVLFALTSRPVGIVSSLSSTTPVMILPLLWWSTGLRPAPAAWLGAALAVTGVIAIVSGL